MNQALVDQIVNAVLYEGYVLYPYRPSVKNRQRWTFGGLYPRSYCEARESGDAWAMQTECLVSGVRPAIHVKVRFLHLMARIVGELCHPQKQLADGDEPSFRVVEALQVGDRLLQTWQEAVEREVILGEWELISSPTGSRRGEFAFPGERRREAVYGEGDMVVGVVVREQQSIAGRVETSAEAVGDGLFRVRVRIENRTPLEDAGGQDRDAALLRSLVSTHTILGVLDGEFVSLLDPPAEHAKAAAGCRNVGAYPVLVGEEGARDTMLSSPIILYDYPRTAPESPGDLFDGAEIDEILSLRILTLTDAEKQAAAGVDERVRALLHRTAALTNEQLLGLHGAMRGLRPLPPEELA